MISRPAGVSSSIAVLKGIRDAAPCLHEEGMSAMHEAI